MCVRLQGKGREYNTYSVHYVRQSYSECRQMVVVLLMVTIFTILHQQFPKTILNYYHNVLVGRVA